MNQKKMRKRLTQQEIIELLNAPSDLHPAVKIEMILELKEMLDELWLEDEHNIHGNGD